MVIIVAGSRSITDEAFVADLILTNVKDICVGNPLIISGGAAGVDSFAKKVCNTYNIPFQEYPADWKTYGKRAGYIRNEEMAKDADMLIAIWDGKSKGTRHMINIALDKGLDVYVYQRPIQS